MTKRSERQLDTGELSEELARRFLPPPLSERCLVVPLRLFKCAAFNLAMWGLFLGLLLGGLLALVLSASHILWIGGVSLVVPLAIAKFVIAPIEERFEMEARAAVAPDAPSE